MRRDAAETLKEVLALPIEGRAALAGSLLDSLDTDVDEDAEAAWATAVNRRVAELDSAAVKTIRRSPPPSRRALMSEFAVEFHPLAAAEVEAAEFNHLRDIEVLDSLRGAGRSGSDDW